MDNKLAIKQAIETVVANFAKHAFIHGNGKVNVIDALQEFWNMKLSNSSETATIIYEYLETAGPPYVCFVTLPGNACFATFQNCMTKSEARKSAALIALMNSVFNEHPSRKITFDFIAKSLDDAQLKYANSIRSLEIYRIMLEICLGKTMLEFQQMMTVFQLLHWNGSFKAMKERQCSRDEVINYYCNRSVNDEMRSQLALDWIAREHQNQGILKQELEHVNKDIEMARLSGHELRFLKEKRDILLLALYQLDMEIRAENI
jgi:LIX1-like protein